MGRNREKHKRMPKGWAPGPARKDGTFDIYFRPTNAGDAEIVRAITGGPLSLKLGATMDEASTRFAELILPARQQQTDFTVGYVSEIVMLARRDFLPAIANKKTRAERTRHVDELERLFAKRRYARNVYEASRDTAGLYLRAMDIQKHIFEGRTERHVGVNRAVRTWELVFQWARAPWGLTEYNPCAGLMPNEERSRRVVPKDGSIFKLYRELSPPARFMVGMIRYYGRRKVELLGLEEASGQEDGIHLRRGKDADAKEIIIKWDPRNRKMWARAARWRAKVLRPLLEERVVPLQRKLPTAFLLNTRGRPVTETGFNSERKRAMLRAGIQGEFTFHDMRKSRGQSLTPLEAMNVLAHDDLRTTQGTYRPGAIVVDLNDEVAAKRKAK